MEKKKKKAISQGITIPERAAKKTQVSKQICTTIWNTAREEDRSTCTLVLLNYRGGQRNYSQNISYKTLKEDNVRKWCILLHTVLTLLFTFRWQWQKGNRYHMEMRRRNPLSFVLPQTISVGTSHPPPHSQILRAAHFTGDAGAPLFLHKEHTEMRTLLLIPLTA